MPSVNEVRDAGIYAIKAGVAIGAGDEANQNRGERGCSQKRSTFVHVATLPWLLRFGRIRVLCGRSDMAESKVSSMAPVLPFRKPTPKRKEERPKAA
jgi:hypothetical protein